MDGIGTTTVMLESGIDVIDTFWRGFYRGGRYLAYGRTASGRNLLPMIFLSKATEMLETSLMVTRLRDVDLNIQGSGIGFDSAAARRSGLLRVSRIPAELDVLNADDSALESALKTLSSLIVDSAADRVVIDDFSPFSRFSSIEHFRTAFVRLLDELEHVNSTVLIGMPEPANDASRRIIEIMSSQMAGSIHVHTIRQDNHTQRSLSLIPQIGHATHRMDVPWDLDRFVAGTNLKTRQQPKARESAAGQNDRTVVDSQWLEETPPRETSIETTAPSYAQHAYESEIDNNDGLDDGMLLPEMSIFDETSGQVFEDRSGFEEELQLYFEDFETSGSPFSVVAMRMEDVADTPGTDDFGTVVRIVSESIHREDSMFADPVTERIVVILGEEEDNAAQKLFSRVKEHMRNDLPNRAEHLMNSVSAVVVNNGSPFVTAGEFLRYVLDEA